jgi:hypothetical protein
MKIYDKIDDVDVWKLRQSLQDPSVQGSRELVTLWGTIPLTILRKIVCHLNSSKTRSTRSKSTAITSVDGRRTWKVQLTKNIQKPWSEDVRIHPLPRSRSVRRFQTHGPSCGLQALGSDGPMWGWILHVRTSSIRSYHYILTLMLPILYYYGTI